MRTLITLYIALLIISPLARADANTDIPALIKQLGDDSPKAREDASDQLRKLGKDALPALQQAQSSTDPEVVTRAQAIAKQIEEDRHPRYSNVDDPPFDGHRMLRINPGAPGQNFQLRIQSNFAGDRGVRQTTAVQDGKLVSIKESPDGIGVSTTQLVNGEQVTKVVTAKSKEALKKDNPEAYALYEKFAATTTTTTRLPIPRGDLRIEGLNPEDQARIDQAFRDADRLLEERHKILEERIRQLRQRAAEQGQ